MFPWEVSLTQETFRILLKSMSHPGEFYPMTTEFGLTPFKRICLTLIDSEVNYVLIGSRVTETLVKEIQFLTGSRPASVHVADYVLIAGQVSEEILFEVKKGSIEEPEDGATLIYEIGNNTLACRTKIMAKGPGIPDEKVFELKGLSTGTLKVIKSLNADYPQGVDVILCYGNGIVSLTRSTNFQIIP